MKKITTLMCAVALWCSAQAQAPALHFGRDGKFRIAQFTDVHLDLGTPYRRAQAEKTIAQMRYILDAEHPDRVKAIAAQGSLVANHTQTHETSVIYQDAESCLKAFDDGRDTIASILGSDYPNDLVRFPYGSTNRRWRDYRDAVKNAGYRFFDWNALNGDAESGASKRTSDDLYQELKNTVDKQYKKGNDIIVLMHDTNSKTNTVKMLPDAIDYIRSLGYTFETLEHKPMS